MWELDGEKHLEINAEAKQFVCSQCNMLITTQFYDTIEDVDKPYRKEYIWKCHLCNNFYLAHEEDPFKKFLWTNANFMESVNELAKNSGEIDEKEIKDTEEWIEEQRKKVLGDDKGI